MTRETRFRDLWVIVQNWDEFQHYKDRDPPWIRVYLDLHRRDEYLRLTAVERGLLLDIWLTFAETNGQMRVSTQARLKHDPHATHARPEHFIRLCDAGFIALSASKPLPQRQRQRQNPRVVTSEVDANGNNSGFQIPENLLKDVPR